MTPVRDWDAKVQRNYWPPVAPGANPLGWVQPFRWIMKASALSLPPLGGGGRGGRGGPWGIGPRSILSYMTF